MGWADDRTAQVAARQGNRLAKTRDKIRREELDRFQARMSEIGPDTPVDVAVERLKFTIVGDAATTGSEEIERIREERHELELEREKLKSELETSSPAHERLLAEQVDFEASEALRTKAGVGTAIPRAEDSKVKVYVLTAVVVIIEAALLLGTAEFQVRERIPASSEGTITRIAFIGVALVALASTYVIIAAGREYKRLAVANKMSALNEAGHGELFQISVPSAGRAQMLAVLAAVLQTALFFMRFLESDGERIETSFILLSLIVSLLPFFVGWLEYQAADPYTTMKPSFAEQSAQIDAYRSQQTRIAEGIPRDMRALDAEELQARLGAVRQMQSLSGEVGDNVVTALSRISAEFESGLKPLESSSDDE